MRISDWSSDVCSSDLPLVGRLGDRFGARRVLVPGILLFGLGMMSLSLVGNSLALYTSFTVLVGIASVVQSPLPYSMVVTHLAPLPSCTQPIAICTIAAHTLHTATPPLWTPLIAPSGW